MQLDLTEVVRVTGGTVEKPIEISAGPLEEVELTQPVEGWVRATNARRNIVVRGKASTVVKLECARCLEPFDQPMEFPLDVTVPLSTFNALLGAARVHEEAEDTAGELTQADIAALFSEHALNVSELVRQAVVLNAPIKPLCRADCEGLPEAALYKATTGDPRWDALKNLNGQLSPQGEDPSQTTGDE